jgi:4-amino-4-deoxy-L-arabinose transferase-like glycosyltransferase
VADFPAVASAAAEEAEEAAAGRPDRGRAVVVLALVVFAVAVWLRFAGLGGLSFWADEFPHAVAARSLIESGSPSLPSGASYGRALGHTVAVSVSMRAFGIGERAARIPSAIVGTATVAALWLVVRRRFGVVAGLTAAAMLAVVPLHVAHSRSARFYAAFALAYGLTAMAWWWALRDPSWRSTSAAATGFAVALHLHVAAVELVPPSAVAAFFLWRAAAGAERRARGRVLAIAGAVAVLAVATTLAFPEARRAVAAFVRSPVPGLRWDPGFHPAVFARLFGVVRWWAWIGLAPAALAGLRRMSRDGVFLVAHVLVPVLLLAVVYPDVERRYLLHLVPFVCALAGIGAAELAHFFVGEGRRVVLAPAIGVVGLAGWLTVFSIPGSAHPGAVIPHPNWRAAAAAVRAGWIPGDVILTTSPIATWWENGVCGEWLRARSWAAPYLRPDGRDVACDSALIASEEDLRRFMLAHPRGWLMADRFGWARTVDPAVRKHVEALMQPIPMPDGSIMLFRWQ